MGVADWPNSSGIRLSLIPIFQDCRTSCNRSSPGSGPRQIDHAEGAIMVFRLAVRHRNRWVRTAGQPLFARPGDRPAAGALIRRDSASVGLVFRPLYTITSAIAGRGTGCERISQFVPQRVGCWGRLPNQFVPRRPGQRFRWPGVSDHLRSDQRFPG